MPPSDAKSISRASFALTPKIKITLSFLDDRHRYFTLDTSGCGVSGLRYADVPDWNELVAQRKKVYDKFGVNEWFLFSNNEYSRWEKTAEQMDNEERRADARHKQALGH